MHRTFEDLDAEVRALGYDTTILLSDEDRHIWRVWIATRPFDAVWLAHKQAWACASRLRRNPCERRVLADLRASLWAAVVEDRGDSECRLAVAQWEHEQLGHDLRKLESGVISWEPAPAAKPD